MRLLWLSALAAVSVAAAADVSQLTVYLNGESTQEKQGVLVPLSAELLAGPFDALVEACRQALSSARPEEPDLEQPCAMSGANGLPLSAAAELGALGAAGAAGSVWLVPNHRRWIWPVGKLRERIELPDVTTAMDGKTVALESLSASPRVFYIHNLVSEEEMKAIKATTLAIDDKYGKLQPSTVGAGAEMRRDPTRTSDSAFVPSSAEAMTIKRRSFELLRIAPYDDMQVGGLQVLRYRAAQAYRDHHDYFPADTSGSGDDGFSFDSRHGGSNRMATVFVFLSDVEAGGALTFPNPLPGKFVTDIGDAAQQAREAAAMEALAANGTMQKGSWEWEMSEACRTGLSVRPKRGNAVLFYSQDPGGRLDPRSLHGGCPVLSNVTEKWAANIWVWNKRRVHHDPTRSKMHGGDGKTGAKPGAQPGQETIRFLNEVGATISLYWQAAGTEPTFWAEVMPGSTAESSTWVGHTWLAKKGKEFSEGGFLWKHAVVSGDTGDLAISATAGGAKDEL